MQKKWWFWIPVIALALYGSSNDFNLSPAWFPFAVGVAILAPLLLLPQLRRLGLVRKGGADQRITDRVILYCIAVVTTGLIIGSALPTLGTKLMGSETRTPVTVSARKKRSQVHRSIFSEDYYQLEFRFPDGVAGTHSIDEDTFRRFEWIGGKTTARIRQSWFGFEVLEIEASGNPPSGIPKLVF